MARKKELSSLDGEAGHLEDRLLGKHTGMEIGGVGGRCDVSHFSWVGPWEIQMEIQKSRAQKTDLDGG